MRNAVAFQRLSGTPWKDMIREGLEMKKSHELGWRQVVMAANAPMLYRSALVDGNADIGVMATGQVVGLIDDVPSCAELIDRIAHEAESVGPTRRGQRARLAHNRTHTSTRRHLMNQLKDRVIVVTGAGRGIGREHALLAAAEGARVVVNDTGAGRTARARTRHSRIRSRTRSPRQAVPRSRTPRTSRPSRARRACSTPRSAASVKCTAW